MPTPSPRVPEATPLLRASSSSWGPGYPAPPPLPLTLLTSENLRLKPADLGKPWRGGGQYTLCPQASECRPSAPPALLQVW